MDFYKGVDISSLLESEENGLKLYTENGDACEALDLCRKNGVNSIRLRIWNEPERIPESGGYCDLEHTVVFAKRIKAKGLHFLLDFHYSDFWADPGNQRKPAAWENLNREELVRAVYDYTKEALERLREENCLPDMVQIGNEIRSGMLFPDGEVPHYDMLTKLVNAGMQAVRDVDGGIRLMIHLDQGGRYYYLKEWFDAMSAAGLESFDVIGLSYYPFWHGTFTDLKNSMEALAERYRKPIIVVEAAHPWRRGGDGFISEEQEKIAGFPAGIEEQRTVMRLLMNIVASVKEQMGLGVYYWEPLVLPMKGQGSWANNMGMLDLTGKALPAFKEFLFERTDASLNNIAKIYEPEPVTVKRGVQPKLPETLDVLRFDGWRYPYRTAWEMFQTGECGTFRVKGYIEALAKEVSAEVKVVSELPVQVNLVKNADFSAGYENWTIVKRPEDVRVELNPEENSLTVSSRRNFFFCITQDVRITQPGRYGLSVAYRGTNTTGVEVKLFGEQIAGENLIRKEKNIYPTDDNWVKYDIVEIVLNEGTFIVGLEIKAPPVMGKIREFCLYKMD
ncbi:MAG: arabinogalactan endo-1,4-beta-galactosidase [Bacteroidales bacterium]|nr:arabinogalactan endo-1,4-beta-galactosidase [Bacteroidales bacterium]MCM1416198.1 arabinogalactan endo-1,4-beta-galactosidase [bacterium]MCM1424644.1 arabinogalactan endo-1,4-beta-galactosidase [bacterium]